DANIGRSHRLLDTSNLHNVACTRLVRSEVDVEWDWPNTSGNGTSRKQPSLPEASHCPRKSKVRRVSSFKSTLRAACTTTSAWRWRAGKNHGHCPRGFPGNEVKNISQWKWRIIRSNTQTSKELSRRGNMAAAR